MIDYASPGPAHSAFARLRFDKVITTNFDFLLETAYAQAGAVCDVIVDEEQLPIPATLDSKMLLKLHGDLRHPTRLVATEDDYDGFLARYPVLATYVSSLLIERIPVLIGYSLNDPDLRQLLAMLRDRLGAMLPGAYVITVGADASAAARYGRRGVKVINLPGDRSSYGEVLAGTFRELDDYWRSEVLSHVRLTDERALEQVETAVRRKTSRLCYFSVPARMAGYYKDQVFPLAERAGLVPVSGFDVEAPSGNRLAAIGALIERAQLAVVDMTEGAGMTEVNAAVQLLGVEKVLVVASRGIPTPVSMYPGLRQVVTRDSLDNDSLDALDGIYAWLMEHAIAAGVPGVESKSLLELGQSRAALIAAVSELEIALNSYLQDRPSGEEIAGRYGWRRAPLRRMILSHEAPFDPPVRQRLLDWVGLRNKALHEGAKVSLPEASEAVDDIHRALRELRA